MYIYEFTHSFSQAIPQTLQQAHVRLLAARCAATEVLLDVRLAMTGSAKAHLTVRANERLGAGVQAHVHLEAALSREAGVADVAAERLLDCKKSKQPPLSGR